MSIEIGEIKEKLDNILSEIQELKHRLSDPDIYLTKEEKKLLKESYISEKKRKQVPHSELKKMLRL